MKKIFSSLLLFTAVFLISSVQSVFAGTDLTVVCANQGPCTVSPVNTPLFQETLLLPGETRIQNLTITNSDVNDTCNLTVDINDVSSTQPVNLATRVFAAITSGGTSYVGSVNSGAATSGTTYQNLYQNNAVSLGSLAPGATRTYTWYATFDPTAGNEYQGVQTRFDVALSLNCGSPPTPTPTPTSNPSSGGGNGSGNSGGGGSAPNNAQPPVCSDTAPTVAPNVSITSVGTNTVTLTWSPVSPVTHYALFFTRDSDGAQYGSPNIGNVTSYTITNLSGNASYTFQVMAVNGCAPGPRSGAQSSRIIPGAVITSRPLGNGGQVLGTTTNNATTSPSPSATASATPLPVASAAGSGEVAGVSDDVCINWQRYVPWLLLVFQFIVILISEYKYRYDSGWTKFYVTIGMTLLSIGLFYLLRECDCYGEWSWQAWLCKWYWLVSLLLTLLLRGFSFAFLDETGEKEVPPAYPVLPRDFHERMEERTAQKLDPVPLSQPTEEEKTEQSTT